MEKAQWFLGIFMHFFFSVGPVQLQLGWIKLQLSLESFEIHLTTLRQEILHAQDILSTFEALSTSRR